MNSFYELSARGRIEVTGEDRARLLHAMTTNHVQGLQSGQGLYAFFLSAQGRIQADAVVLCFADRLLLDTEPESRAFLLEHLDRYIIADDATLEDVTESTFCLEVEHPESNLSPFSHSTVDGITTAAVSATGAPSVRYYGPITAKAALLARLAATGAVPATAEQLEAARISHFVPRFGTDITDATLPQETQLTHALHFQKGCYLGQEIVERVRSRGHVNRQLMGFRMAGHHAPQAGAILTSCGKETGEVTSAAVLSDGVAGIAMVRVPHNKPGEVVGIDGRPAELFHPAVPSGIL